MKPIFKRTFILLALLFVTCGMGKNAAASDSAAAFTVLGQASDFTPPPGLGAWLACLFYICAIAAAVKHFASLNTGKQLTKEVFDEYRKSAEESRDRMEKDLEDLSIELSKARKADAFARRLIHHQVNGHDSALHFMAGQHEKGQRIKDILARPLPQQPEDTGNE